MKKFVCLILILLLIPLYALSEDSTVDVCGKWSFYWDLRDLPIALQNAVDDSVMSYELYIFPDGSANMTKMTMNKKGRLDFSYGALSGVWLGDSDSLVIRLDTSTFKAELKDGFLNLYFTDKIIFPFVRIDQSDLLYQQLVK